ncbi:MAG: enoyl-CoA hydratase/isomerase family protein [Allomuricauda sp.]|nr:MAG: enoyl-CoA hydratase/isomerase family protein [Allomuricauda sp.]
MNTLDLHQKEGYTIVQMNRGKVNAINQEMVNELSAVFRKLEYDKATKGAILTGIPNFFSAGLDLIELIGYDKAQMTRFFQSFGSLYAQLLKFKKPLICAITGHSPAGGCVLAIACDNRYMAAGEKFRIGLNEVAVNVQISQDLTNAYAFWLGNGLAHRYILEGKLLNTEEAVAAGLVDEVVPLEGVLQRAEKQMQKYLQADQEIWISTKGKLRKQLLNNLEKNPAEAMNEASELWWKPEIRAKMEAYVNSFSNKKK